MKYLTKFLFIALISTTLLVQCKEGQKSFAVGNITATAIGDPELSTLVAALTKANLLEALNADGPFTVFAPTNAAFTQLLANLGAKSLDDIDNATLTAVLLYHVVSGSVKSTDLTTTYVPTLSDGAAGTKADIYVDIENGVKLNGSSTVTTADITASNGVIHKIDKVLLPPSVVDIALNNSNFTSLVAALTRTGNTTDFVSVLSGAGPFTVFAPTNTAFQALLDSNNDWTTLADIPEPTLDAVLKYHVVGGANVLAGTLTDGQVVTTVGENTFNIDLSSGAQIKAGSNATNVNIIITDVQGTNGVVHAIDQVLIP